MERIAPFVITISRQLGSGGAYIGQQLAKKLNVLYVDREIISRAAEQLSVLEEELESREEKLLPFWQSFGQFSVLTQDVYIPPKMTAPTDRELFNAEAEIIEHIAKERSAVIIGRCGSHILREYPNHVSIFLHGDITFRIGRVRELYNIPEEAAAKMITRSDKERALHFKTFTGKEWADARNYNLALDTGRMPVDKSIELILNYLELLFR